MSLIDFGFSQQSMFRSRHLRLNEAAASIKEAALCLSAVANQCNKTERFPGLMRPRRQNEGGEWKMQRRGGGIGFLFECVSLLFPV